MVSLATTADYSPGFGTENTAMAILLVPDGLLIWHQAGFKNVHFEGLFPGLY